jgi:hypothetical protein
MKSADNFFDKHRGVVIGGQEENSAFWAAAPPTQACAGVRG